jgi:multicomponent Na+:H+ antiporter subunit D
VSWLPVLPLLVPLFTAVAALLAARSRTAQRWISAAGALVLLGVSVALLGRVLEEGILVVQPGAWPAPFGISVVADLLGAIMVLLTGAIGAAVGIYSLSAIPEENETFGHHPLYHILLMGVNGAFLTGDLFNLYVWFEVLLIASFVLLVLGNRRGQVRGAVAYVTVNLAASALFLAGIGLLYGATGALNMADLSVRLPEVDSPGLVTALSMLFLVAFGVKAAVFPLFYWLPASYHTPPAAVSAVFAGLLTKVGVYALIRVFTLLFTADVAFTHTLLLVVAGVTMVTGVLGAAAQTDVRRILSFHIVSQIGYMIMGLALFTKLALVGAVFYVMHHIIVKANLFLVGGVMHRLGGSSDLGRLGGLYRSRPLLAVLFLIPALSLAGVPPLSGFWAKLVLIQAGLQTGQYLIVGVALAVGGLTLYSMTKIWMQGFWEAQPEGAAPLANPGAARMVPLLLPIAALAAVTLAIGLWAQPLFDVAGAAADQLLDPTAYRRAVLGGVP